MEDTHESQQHHKSSQKTIDRKEDHIQDMLKFTEEKGSPLSPDACQTLQNIVTKELMPLGIRNDM